jgi:signal transduction histidine kinase
LSLVHPEDASAAYEALAGCLAHPRTLVRTRERLRHADGTWRWVDTTAKNMLDEPAVGGLVLNFRDVTEQVELEREQIALRDASAELLDTLNVAELATKVCRIAVERMGLSLVWVGYAGEDGSVTALAGWPDIPPHIVAAPVRWDDTPRGHGPTGEAIRTLTPVVCENVETDSKFDAWRQSALARGIRSSAAIPLNSRDRRFGVLSVYSDVTGFFTPGRMDTFIAYAHHAASALENARLYEELAHELAERKRIEGQLQQAQKMEAVGRLAGGIAQDFNNLLTAIIGYSELARDAARPGSQLEVDLKEVLKAADRATSLTKQLLALSSRQAVIPQCLSLVSVVKDMQRVLPPLLGDRIQIEITLDEQLPDILADRPQIEQVVVNLAVNARDAMPDGGTLRMAVEGVTAPGPDAALQRWVSLVVSDTGCGMDGETVAKIFEPFFTTKERGKGTGLGLSTVYGIVKQNRGQITVDSAPGRGTTFRILLPAQP